MQYLGGKARTYKVISAYLESVREDRDYLEPFVGGVWVLQEMSGDRIASDVNEALITMYTALQSGWTPPENVSEETYTWYKYIQDTQDPVTAFAGFGCSFAGKWFGGYARSGERNYAGNAKNSLLKQLPKIQDVMFQHKDYREHDPHNLLVYCDPPYSNTTGYDGCDAFNSDQFWEVMRNWSRDNVVVISEYSAPNDFECVLEIPTKTDMRIKGGSKEPRVERLFRHK